MADVRSTRLTERELSDLLRECEYDDSTAPGSTLSFCSSDEDYRDSESDGYPSSVPNTNPENQVWEGDDVDTNRKLGKAFNGHPQEHGQAADFERAATLGSHFRKQQISSPTDNSTPGLGGSSMLETNYFSAKGGMLPVKHSRSNLGVTPTKPARAASPGITKMLASLEDHPPERPCTPTASTLYRNTEVHCNPSWLGRCTFEECMEFTQWINDFFKYGKMPNRVRDLARDLGDGVTLLDLTEVVVGCPPPQIHAKPALAVQKLENIHICLEYLARNDVAIQGVTAEDIVQGNLKVVLALCHCLRRHFGSASGPLLLTRSPPPTRLQDTYAYLDSRRPRQPVTAARKPPHKANTSVGRSSHEPNTWVARSSHEPNTWGARSSHEPHTWVARSSHEPNTWVARSSHEPNTWVPRSSHETDVSVARSSHEPELPDICFGYEDAERFPHETLAQRDVPAILSWVGSVIGKKLVDFKALQSGTDLCLLLNKISEGSIPDVVIKYGLPSEKIGLVLQVSKRDFGVHSTLSADDILKGRSVEKLSGYLSSLQKRYFRRYPRDSVGGDHRRGQLSTYFESFGPGEPTVENFVNGKANQLQLSRSKEKLSQLDHELQLLKMAIRDGSYDAGANHFTNASLDRYTAGKSARDCVSLSKLSFGSNLKVEGFHPAGRSSAFGTRSEDSKRASGTSGGISGGISGDRSRGSVRPRPELNSTFPPSSTRSSDLRPQVGNAVKRETKGLSPVKAGGLIHEPVTTRRSAKLDLSSREGNSTSDKKVMRELNALKRSPERCHGALHGGVGHSARATSDSLGTDASSVPGSATHTQQGGAKSLSDSSGALHAMTALARLSSRRASAVS